ncbi:hypothetical protein QY95_00826 [Bacillus thermotolerans]|uniref:Uncharacterized protein n=1 Tax=Bacillus thermotolerans TaxID=1221996 RepID=A0A0F5I746_BACTR|nr:hypothetical protein QY95_00826 [Bacillus thermotolerans]
MQNVCVTKNRKEFCMKKLPTLLYNCREWLGKELENGY